MNKCYWCLYHAVFLTIIIIKKLIPPGKVTLYSHARKDSVSSEKLVSNFLLSGADQAPDPGKPFLTALQLQSPGKRRGRLHKSSWAPTPMADLPTVISTSLCF